MPKTCVAALALILATSAQAAYSGPDYSGLYDCTGQDSQEGPCTGIARFSRNAKGKWRFHKFYYEPEFKGGNHGSEDSAQR